MSLVVITDTGQLDTAPALAALRSVGHEVMVLESTDPATIRSHAAQAHGLIVSFAPITADVLDALPALRVIATPGRQPNSRGRLSPA